MKKIFSYFKTFHKEYYSTRLYTLVLLFIAGLITFNYYFDFEDSFIDRFYHTPWRIPLFIAYHGIAYYGVLGIIYLYDKQRITFTKSFLLKSLLGLFILSIDRSVFPFLSHPILQAVPHETMRFYNKVLNNAYGWFTIVFTFWMVKLWLDRKEDFGIYGLKLKKIDWSMYVPLLLIVIPLVYAGSHLQQFIDYYPLYKKANGLQFANYYRIPEFYSKIIYELFYVTDFLNTELMFRGFLVIGLSKLMGKNVILPMAATYCVLHFGKPMGETISSVFGGYILGIIALYSRNIWGGVFIHGGTAFFMEVFAFLKQ